MKILTMLPITRFQMFIGPFLLLASCNNWSLHLSPIFYCNITKEPYPLTIKKNLQLNIWLILITSYNVQRLQNIEQNEKRCPQAIVQLARDVSVKWQSQKFLPGGSNHSGPIMYHCDLTINLYLKLKNSWLHLDLQTLKGWLMGEFFLKKIFKNR